MTAPTLTGPACAGSVQVCRIRAARLDADGTPLAGATSLYVTDAVINIGLTYNLTQADSFEQKNGCGQVRQSYDGQQKLKSVGLAMTLCTLDYELLELMDLGDALTKAGETVGIAFHGEDAADSFGISLEGWSKAWDGNQQLTDGSGNLLWHHWVWPKTTWGLGNKSLENNPLAVPVTGVSVPNSGFGDGPGNEVDWVVSGPEAVFLDDTIPDAVCGYQTLAAS